MTDAYLDGNDAISISVSRPGGWPSQAVAALASNIASKGVPLTVAAGNYGVEGGPFYAASPADASSTTSVGGVDSLVLIVQSLFAQGGSGGERSFPALSLQSVNITGVLPVKIIDPDVDSRTDGCDPDKVAAAGPFDGAVVLLASSDVCFPARQLRNVRAHGGNSVLLYSHAPHSHYYGYSPFDGQTLANMLKEDGAYIKQQVKAGVAVKIDFTRQTTSLIRDSQGGGQMTDFSAAGPNFDLSAAPVLSAPGGNIIGAYPLSRCTYL